MSASIWPKAGDGVLHCGHCFDGRPVERNAHWRRLDPPIVMEALDGTHVVAAWAVACGTCFRECAGAVVYKGHAVLASTPDGKDAFGGRVVSMPDENCETCCGTGWSSGVYASNAVPRDQFKCRVCNGTGHVAAPAEDQPR